MEWGMGDFLGFTDTTQYFIKEPRRDFNSEVHQENKDQYFGTEDFEQRGGQWGKMFPCSA